MSSFKRKSRTVFLEELRPIYHAQNRVDNNFRPIPFTAKYKYFSDFGCYHFWFSTHFVIFGFLPVGLGALQSHNSPQKMTKACYENQKSQI